MRMLMRVTIPVEPGNKGFRDGSLPKLIESTIAEYKPEAAYFLADGGQRTAHLVLDVRDSSQLPALAEPFFLQLNAKVDFQPAMNADDLRAGIEKAQRKL